jgi:hypothetical protein
MASMSATTSQGIQVLFSKQTGITNLLTRYRVDTFFGVVNKNPEQSGIIMYSQP